MKRLAALLPLLPLALAAAEPALPDGLYAEITTARGVITCELEFECAPLTVANFVGLAEGTLGPAPRKPFFDGLKFHRVVPGFVIQGGDPLGTGEGGPGYAFPDEFVPGLGHGSAGTLSMANDGPDTNGSQFFLTLAPVERLNYMHPVFGKTVRGVDVLAKVVAGDEMHVRIVRRGASALAFRADDASFAALSAKAKRYAAAPEPGPRSLFDDPDKLLPADPPRARNFNFKLGNVERSAGLRIYMRVFAKLPGALTRPPEACADRIARLLKLGDDEVLAAYFAEGDQWVFRMGPTSAAAFIGSAPGPQKSLGKGSLEAATEAFLQESGKRAAPNTPPSPKRFYQIFYKRRDSASRSRWTP